MHISSFFVSFFTPTNCRVEEKCQWEIGIKSNKKVRIFKFRLLSSFYEFYENDDNNEVSEELICHYSSCEENTLKQKNILGKKSVSKIEDLH